MCQYTYTLRESLAKLTQLDPAVVVFYDTMFVPEVCIEPRQSQIDMIIFSTKL